MHVILGLFAVDVPKNMLNGIFALQTVGVDEDHMSERRKSFHISWHNVKNKKETHLHVLSDMK